MESTGGTTGERLEIFVSRGKMIALLAFMGPPGIGGAVAGALAGAAGGWIIAALTLPLCVLLARELIRAGEPFLVVDRTGIAQKKGARAGESIAWADVERLELVALSHRARRGASTSHTLDVHLRGEEKPVELALSHLKGNSIDLAEQVAAVAGMPLGHVEQDTSLLPMAGVTRRSG